MIRDLRSRRGRAKRYGWEIGLLTVMLGPRDELNDLCTHTNASHAAMAIRPASASDIKYVVIGFPSELNVRQIAHMRPFGARTLSLAYGAACGSGKVHAACRHVRACRLIGSHVTGSDDGAQTTLKRQGWEMWRRGVRPPSDSRISMKKPAADFSARASDFLRW